MGLFHKRRSKSELALPLTLTPVTSGGLARLFDGSHNLWLILIRMELPPIVLYGTPVDLAGAIVSGLIFLDTAEDFTVVELLELTIVQKVRYLKPFMLHLGSVTLCKQCQVKETELARWDIVKEPTSFTKGRHAYPFSHLLLGQLPPLAKLGLSLLQSYIQYDLIAVANAGVGSATSTSGLTRVTSPGVAPVNTGGVANLSSLQADSRRPQLDSGHHTTSTVVKIPLHVTRLIPRGADRNSLRVFPPTEVTAGAVLPNVAYPKLTFPIELRLDNVVLKSGERRWRMRKLAWKMEENVKVAAHVCDKHKHKLESAEDYERKSKLYGPKEQAAKGNLHHLTIQTGVVLTRNPLQYVDRNSPPPEEGNRDVVIDDGENEQPRTNIADVHNSFVEDFIRYGYRTNLGATTPSGLATATPLGAATPLGVATPVPGAAASTPIGAAAVANRMRRFRHPDQPPVPAAFTDDGLERLYLEETRVVRHGEIKSGWKLDFSNRGKVEMVAHIDINDFFTGWHKPVTTKSSLDDNRTDMVHQNARLIANVACDIDDPTLGIFVTHTLVVEVVVAEEVIHDVNKRPALKKTRSLALQVLMDIDGPDGNPPAVGVPTGAARVLRMQFSMPLTERLGLGISWDDEVPPTYEDVRCLSPPQYVENRLLAGVERQVVMSDSPILGAVVSRNNTEMSLDKMVDLSLA